MGPVDVDEAVRRYAASWPSLGPVAESFVATVTAILDEAGINYLSVTGRAKAVASFAAKAARERDGERVHLSLIHI